MKHDLYSVSSKLKEVGIVLLWTPLAFVFITCAVVIVFACVHILIEIWEAMF